MAEREFVYRERERETKKVTFAPFSDSEYSNPPAECERGKWLGRREKERKEIMIIGSHHS